MQTRSMTRRLAASRNGYPNWANASTMGAGLVRWLTPSNKRKSAATPVKTRPLQRLLMASRDLRLLLCSRQSRRPAAIENAVDLLDSHATITPSGVISSRLRIPVNQHRHFHRDFGVCDRAVHYMEAHATQCRVQEGSRNRSDYAETMPLV